MIPVRLQDSHRHPVNSRLSALALTTLTIIGVITLISQAQVDRGAHEVNVFDSLQRSVAAIRMKSLRLDFSAGERREADKAMDSISRNVDFIREVAIRRVGVRMPEEYSRSLSLHDSLLRVVADAGPMSRPSNRRVISVLQEVASDLEIKAAYIHTSRGTALRLVQVVVHTLKDNKELGGYEVWFVPKGWADDPGAFRRFGRLSSPTYMDLAPGNYLMWVQKGQSAAGKQTFSVGKQGKSRDEIDLEIP